MAIQFFVLVVTVFLSLTGCQTAASISSPAPPGLSALRFAPKAVDVALPGSTYLHDPKDPPIHIGDGRGEINDIPTEFRVASPPTGYGWKFLLPAPATGAQVEINMFSLVEASNSAGCHTYALLNGAPVAQLNTFPGAGSGSNTLAVISLKPEGLKAGENRLEIVEAPCTGPAARGAFNDSLIRSVQIRVTK